MSEHTTLYKARSIVTMDPAYTLATHVAVTGDIITAIGGEELEHQFGPANSSFAEFVLTPGFVEGHAHAMEGMIWKLPYVGFYDRTHPDGSIVSGCQSVDELVRQLIRLDKEIQDPNETLFAWGYDSIYFSDKPLRGDLDRVSNSRPVVIFHSNLHLITVNSETLVRAGINHDTLIEGVYVDANGEPNGELAEVAAMFPVFRAVGNPVFGELADEEGLRRFGQSCHRAGITTSADLYNELDDKIVDIFSKVTLENDFPTRIVPALTTTQLNPNQAVEQSHKLVKRGNKKLFMGSAKITTDGSIQGFSARVRQPYINGIENGLWYVAPPQLREMIQVLHSEKIKMHIHVNGDEAAELVLQTFEQIAQEENLKQLHVLQHAQMMDKGQLQRAAKIGLMVNLFANHTYYWGDQHRDATVGPDIAPRMNAARTALDCGLEIAIHSDAPVSPLAPLFTAWCAVNRLTASGQKHGLNECINTTEALRAITMGGAISMDLGEQIGSIEVGKYADFTVLKENPLEVDAIAIKDIEIVGTMLGGNWQPLS
ncbi:MAG: putative amidohydrolase YtcJ [Parasphingorhabdus sp.]|jgi:predicted amidohydrolase YtcJ